MEKGRIIKGSFGYLKRRFTRVLFLTILMFVSAIGVMVIGIAISGSKKNLLTIVAILGLLPACRSLIEFIMLIKAQKYKCTNALHETIEKNLKDLDCSFLRYDMYMTAYEHNFPMYVVACKGGSLVCYMGDSKQEEKDVKAHLENLLKQNALKTGNIKIYFSDAKFVERITDMGRSEQEITEMDYKVLRLMENISL